MKEALRAAGQWALLAALTPVWLAGFAVALVQDAWDERKRRDPSACGKCGSKLPPSHQCDLCQTNTK